MLGVGGIVHKAATGSTILRHRLSDPDRLTGWGFGWFLIVALLLPRFVHAEDTVCARVKTEIRQELTLERQHAGRLLR